MLFLIPALNMTHQGETSERAVNEANPAGEVDPQAVSAAPIPAEAKERAQWQKKTRIRERSLAFIFRHYTIKF